MSITTPPSSTMPPIDTRYARIIAIALPVLLANLAMPLQSVIDTAIVGNMNETAKLAGMGLAIQLLSLLLVSFNFLQYASSGLSAQAIGQLAGHSNGSVQETNDSSNIIPSPLLSILQRALLLAFVIGAILLLAKPWIIDFGLQALSANPESGLAAKTYLDVRFWGVIAELMNFAFIGWFAGQGKTRYMLYQQGFIAILNIILTLFFVFGLQMGLVGVALGTTIAFWSGVLLALWLSRQHLGISWTELFQADAKYFTKEKILRLFSLNKDIFIRTLILTLSFAWITRLSAQSGDVILAANAILLQVLSISAFALDGVAVSAETLSGQAAGRRDWPRFRLIVKRTGIVSYGLAIILSTIWWLLMPTYLQLMTNIDTVFALANDYRLYAVLLPLVGVGAYWLDGIFFGLTAGSVIRNAALILAAIFFPLSWLLYQQWDMTGIWLSVWCLLLLRLFILGIFLYRAHQTGSYEKLQPTV
ncbi:MULTISPECIES: MATE family efflux transporter [Psychrobacter]|uniref:DNA damage-inducible protein F n=1 Tax=Psychrobacter alimentarius TaxID=261164 RepID=A0ABN4N6M1_9GAMM|nr:MULTISPECIES: MATE family efflux transporter [Psychrobacter]AMT96679.1 DNA damage-inducible protein F [Psychrobacter alimentarius]QCB30947.1 MATE family efflux transporter [Psychrobacter sp. PAMC27889]